MTSGAAYYHRGLKKVAERKVTSAIENFNLAESLGMDRDSCSAQRWYCWMLAGEFENAWIESDAIAERSAPSPPCLWDGRPLAGTDVIVRSLHGYGDAIQFARYLPLLKAQANRVMIEADPALVCVFRDQEGVDDAFSWGEETGVIERKWNQQIEIMELARAFRTTIATIPRRVPYLTIPDHERRQFAFVGSIARPRVGLVWAASDWDITRSIPVNLLQPIVELRNISLFSIQHGKHRSDLAHLRAPAHVHDTAEYCCRIIDTAALIEQLDLVITVDTMVAHLAGALGIEVWTILQSNADWRWMLNRGDTPWYPTMRLFRQKRPGSWDEPLEEVVRGLRNRIAGGPWQSGSSGIQVINR